jgi:phosphate transport system permease protein
VTDETYAAPTPAPAYPAELSLGAHANQEAAASASSSGSATVGATLLAFLTVLVMPRRVFRSLAAGAWVTGVAVVAAVAFLRSATYAGFDAFSGASVLQVIVGTTARLVSPFLFVALAVAVLLVTWRATKRTPSTPLLALSLACLAAAPLVLQALLQIATMAVTFHAVHPAGFFGLLVPGAPAIVRSLLAPIDVFGIWAFVLIVVAAVVSTRRLAAEEPGSPAATAFAPAPTAPAEYWPKPTPDPAWASATYPAEAGVSPYPASLAIPDPLAPADAVPLTETFDQPEYPGYDAPAVAVASIAAEPAPDYATHDVPAAEPLPAAETFEPPAYPGFAAPAALAVAAPEPAYAPYEVVAAAAGGAAIGAAVAATPVPAVPGLALAPDPLPPSSSVFDRRRGLWSRILQGVIPVVCWSAVVLLIAVCFSIIAYLFVEGISAVSWDFLRMDPQPSFNEALSGGIRTPIAGTLILLIVGTLLVVPPALATATYLSEYMREDFWLTRSVRMGLEALAGVPSVVFGMFGIAFFALSQFTFLSAKAAEPGRALGQSFLVGAVVLTIHILPFVIKVMEEAIRSVPNAYRQAAAALGMPKWATTWKIVLPAAGPGIMTAIILGMGILAGDTAIIKLCVGDSMVMTGSAQWWLPWNWMAALHGQGSTLTTFTYYSSAAGEGNSPTKAFGAAFVLIVIVLVLNIAVEFFMRQRHTKSAD